MLNIRISIWNKANQMPKGSGVAYRGLNAATFVHLGLFVTA
ncbi:MAG: hypothetical protein QG593_296 [Patescibacteria group bacterium]|jgi:hypothetical protein|nr:hypothetical protein [Patescibacteria group bacterium]